MLRFLSLGAGALFVAVTFAAAQQAPNTGPAPRPIGPVFASSAMEFGEIRQIRVLADGRILVNDGVRRQISILDPTLKTATAIIDSTPGRATSYGEGTGGILPWLGDSSLFVDTRTSSLVVLDPAGHVGRVMAVARNGGLSTARLAEPTLGAGLSALSLRYGLVSSVAGYAPDPPPGARDSTKFIAQDSVVVMGMNPSTRELEELVSLASGATREWTVKGGRSSVGRLLPTLMDPRDAWAVMADGSIAILRTRDYHMEWLGVDGAYTKSPRIPFPGGKLTDDEKAHLVDSVNADHKRNYETQLAAKAADSLAGRNLSTTTLANGTTRVRSTTVVVAPRYYEVANVGDYRVATVSSGATMFSDGDDNVWIHVAYPGASTGGGVYDIVNRKGALIDRVQLPDGRTLVGVGAGGVAYLVSHDAGLARLEEVRLR